MKYRVKPTVTVDACEILEVKDITPPDYAAVGGVFNVLLSPGEGAPDYWAEIDPAMTSRMTPQVGDYFVTTQDGYKYLNPMAVFESKYDPIRDDSAEGIAARSRLCGDA